MLRHRFLVSTLHSTIVSATIALSGVTPAAATQPVNTAVQFAVEPINPKWTMCETAKDCAVVRGGTSCEWNAVNKNHKEEFSQWIGYINRNKGASPNCQNNLKIQESDMELGCTEKVCTARLSHLAGPTANAKKKTK